MLVCYIKKAFLQSNISKDKSTIVCCMYTLRIIVWLVVERLNYWTEVPLSSLDIPRQVPYTPGRETSQVSADRANHRHRVSEVKMARQKCGRVAQQ